MVTVSEIATPAETLNEGIKAEQNTSAPSKDEVVENPVKRDEEEQSGL